MQVVALTERIGNSSQYQLLKVSLDDHILNRGHRNLEKVRICCICEMAVHFARRCSVESYELVAEVFARLLPVGGVASEIRKPIFRNRTLCHFLLEEIHFIKEEDESRILEPVGVGDRLP